MPIADPTGPLTAEEIVPLLAPLASASGLALAVSGGADSLALLIIVARWRENRADIPVSVMTVDHGLRSGSADEAAMVAEVAATFGFKHRVLAWRPEEPPETNIEAAARAARYRLLIAAAREAGASHLMLAHHRDDVAEALLMRLARGAGVFGLAAMRPSIQVAGQIGRLTLARPLLVVPKERLVATVREAGLNPVEDPMNEDQRFTRARMRRLMPLLEDEGLEAGGLAEAARRLADAADAIDGAATELAAAAAEVDNLAAIHLDRTRFLVAADEVRRRLLVRILAAIGGQDYPPRRERLAALHEALMDDAPVETKRSLAGVICERDDNSLVFYRESGRRGLPEISVKPGFEGLWDQRFSIRVADNAPDGAVVGALGEAGRRAVGWRGKLPGAVVALPALKVGGEIIHVPALNWPKTGTRGLRAEEIVSRRLREPPLFPAYG